MRVAVEHSITSSGRSPAALLWSVVRASSIVEVERIVARYRIDEHDVHVVELVDEDRAWFELIVDGAMLPHGGQVAEPDRDAVVAAVRAWSASHR